MQASAIVDDYPLCYYLVDLEGKEQQDIQAYCQAGLFGEVKDYKMGIGKGVW